MIYWEIFLAFFIPGIVGYGGGPATIPLIQEEVVHNYGWVSTERFGEILAIGNALPGPIVTKMAGYIGYEVGGALGASVALFASVAPSLLAMVFLLKLLYKFKNSPKVKRMTGFIRPTVAVLLGVMAYEFFFTSVESSGIWHMAFLTIASLLLLEKWKVHPAFVIVGALLYGALFLG
ncbi:chromate transporter [Alkalihalobacillus trypoxylicola]|uniref:Transporter n=1 Tax=Alkalihalobacillus trypoxylicola TaxID=519424 RepID=A0A161P8J5_9BACI|nr:chromate transporter [Alkalihalobacillus trypoxylicola]KYG27018.1 transporter [Alkalihalobacillus trypoxylicola]